MKKILFVCNVDWFFVSHRLPIALKAINEGWEVHLVSAITDKKDTLINLGINVHSLPLKRSGVSIFEDIKIIKILYDLVKKISPDILHGITVKCVIYGGIVAKINKVPKVVASISGLGYLFIDNSFKAIFLRFIVKNFYRVALRNKSKVIFQNHDDKSLFLKNNIIKDEQCIIIRGSGVDIDFFKVLDEPKDVKVVMFISRLLKDKGVIEFSNSAKELQYLNNVKFVLVGDIDVGNPNSLSKFELDEILKSKCLEHWGFSNNVEQIIPKANLVVLPSYREGLPKTLIEAAACGRAIVTTDVAGCRDAVEPNVSALLVQKKNSQQLSSAILCLIENDSMRSRFGEAGRRLAETRFNVKDVVQKHMEIYRDEI